MVVERQKKKNLDNKQTLSMSAFTYFSGGSEEDEFSEAESMGTYDLDDPFMAPDSEDEESVSSLDKEVSVHDLKEDEQRIMEESMRQDPDGIRRSNRIRKVPDFYPVDYASADKGHAEDVEELMQGPESGSEEEQEDSEGLSYVPEDDYLSESFMLEGGEEEYILEGEFGPVDEYEEEDPWDFGWIAVQKKK